MEGDGSGGTSHRGLEKAHIQKEGCILSTQVTLQRGYLRADSILFTTTISRVPHSAHTYISLTDYIKLKGAKIKVGRRDPKENEQLLATCLFCMERRNLKDKVFSGIISYIKMGKKKKKRMRTESSWIWEFILLSRREEQAQQIHQGRAYVAVS